ncbi:MAG: lactate racemase domain-containing protein [Eubacteriales bacterium]|nr:lactate racemase domain-containing protein [Eubacteriales bacterium]
MPVLPNSAYQIKLPHMVHVVQCFPDEKIEDIASAVETEIMRDEIKIRIKPGSSAAVLVGSRGISNIKEIVKATVDCLIRLGAQPFIIPAMGSHGGGVAEEQKKIIEGYGITEDYIGVPIRASMDTVVIGETSDGVPVHMDKIAYHSDVIVPVARIKVHTDFYGPIESGLCKMLTIGLGKHNGCSRLHREGFDRFAELIPEAAKVVLQNKYIGFGIAIIENAHEHVHMIKAVSGEHILDEEPNLLAISRSLMPRLQFDDIDVLIVEKIGKDITGAGMDPNIVGRVTTGVTKGFDGPQIKRIIVLGLSDETHNNATGVGAADFITKNVFNEIDLESTYANCIASGDPKAGCIPLIMKDEEEALRAAIQTCPGIDENNAKVVKIKDTLHIIDIEVSTNLLEYCIQSGKFKNI